MLLWIAHWVPRAGPRAAVFRAMVAPLISVLHLQSAPVKTQHPLEQKSPPLPPGSPWPLLPDTFHCVANARGPSLSSGLHLRLGEVELNLKPPASRASEILKTVVNRFCLSRSITASPIRIAARTF